MQRPMFLSFRCARTWILPLGRSIGQRLTSTMQLYVYSAQSANLPFCTGRVRGVRSFGNRSRSSPLTRSASRPERVRLERSPYGSVCDHIFLCLRLILLPESTQPRMVPPSRGYYRCAADWNACKYTVWRFPTVGLKTSTDVSFFQEESNYRTADVVENSRKRRLYWLLFVTERACEF